MKQKLSAILALIGLLCGGSASASTILFTLTVTPGPNTWTLAATDVDPPADNGGIASYGVVLSNVDLLSIDHKSPRDGFAQGPGGVGSAGFTTLRSADALPVILASQDTTTPTPNLIYGFGQAASSFALKGMVDFTAGTQLEAPTWGVPLLIASGTYTGSGAQSIPKIDSSSADTFSNVFIQPSGSATRAATITSQTVIIPEPASAIIGGLAMLGVLGYRRRRA
jgi:hypothetical protein